MNRELKRKLAQSIRRPKQDTGCICVLIGNMRGTRNEDISIRSNESLEEQRIKTFRCKCKGLVLCCYHRMLSATVDSGAEFDLDRLLV